jgi:hypothetical protein
MKAIILLLIIVALVVIGPLATIWALNTLFPSLAIPYAIETWAAVVVLGGALRANVSVKG